MARLVAVTSPADVITARSAASSAAAAELAPGAAAATISAATAVAAGSPAISAAVILLSTATRLAVSGVAASHFRHSRLGLPDTMPVFWSCETNSDSDPSP